MTKDIDKTDVEILNEFSPEQRKMLMLKPLYPNIKVKLTGYDGNAFSIMGKVTKALQNNNISKEIQDEFFKEATSGDYDHVLQTCMKYVEVT